MNYTQSTLRGGGDEILIPVLAPRQQVTISYLYYPPLRFDQINLAIRCDEGLARQLNVLPTPQMRRWRLWLLRVLIAIGAITVIAGGVLLVRWVMGY